jgi:hypothetical protein
MPLQKDEAKQIAGTGNGIPATERVSGPLQKRGASDADTVLPIRNARGKCPSGNFASHSNHLADAAEAFRCRKSRFWPLYANGKPAIAGHSALKSMINFSDGL